QWDMGAVYNVDFRAKILIGNNIGGGGDCIIEIEGSEDNINWYTVDGHNLLVLIISLANVTQIVFITRFVRGRYIRLTWRSGAGVGTHYGAVYEAQAIDLGL
ncbi:unnamed protein product, partial [marine sediment metagenome]